MDRQPLSDQNWEYLNSTAFDQSVLQMGYDDVALSMTLARVSGHLTVIGTPMSSDPTTEQLRLANLRNAAWSAGVYRRLTICRAPWMEALGVFLEQQFDLAVLDPAALGWELIETMVVPVLNAATHLAMLEPPGWDSLAAVTRVCPEPYFRVAKSDQLIVARRVFGSEQDERGGE